MLALQGELTATTILVTHDPTEAALLADELLVLDAARVLQSRPTAEVFRRPVDETAARLLGAEMVAAGIAAEGRAIVIGDGVKLKIAGPELRSGTRVGWSVPAARVRLNDNGRYQGTVESVTAVAAGQQIGIRFGDALIYALAGYADRPRGSACRFDIDADAVRVWPLERETHLP